MPANQQVMEPAVIQRMAYEMMTPEQIQSFEKTKELNLSFGRRDLGNFRVNTSCGSADRSRSSCASSRARFRS